MISIWFDLLSPVTVIVDPSSLALTGAGDGRIEFEDIEALTVLLGSGNDTFTVGATASAGRLILIEYCDRLTPMPDSVRPASTMVNALSLETSLRAWLYRTCGDVSRLPSLVVTTHGAMNTCSSSVQ